MSKLACNNCVYIITCDELPEDYVCPACGSDEEEFVEIPE
jgi:rubredoxin